MKIKKSHLRKIIREELIRSLNEGKCDKASGHEGCIRHREKGWVVISNKTGEAWKEGGKKDGPVLYFDDEEEAKKALGGYHGGEGE